MNPAPPPGPRPNHAPSPESRARIEHGHRPAAKTVLVVEDHVLEREGLAAVLRREGYAVRTAGTGREGVAQFQAEPAPDVVLLDMLLPDGDGWFFLRERSHNPSRASVPVILTSSLRVGSGAWAQSLGAAGYFRKPFDVTALLHDIRCLWAA
jgi:CheY-like chemotaxis protein